MISRTWWKNEEDGENDADAIVLYEGYVQLDDCNSILEKKCSLEDWQSNFGYYELDNDTKFPIIQNRYDECLYARGAYFGWHKIDPNNFIDYPRNRVQMARDKVGYEIMLTVGWHRKSKDSSMNTSIVDNCIPPQSMQASYDNTHGCVWLSACLLTHFVDTKISKIMTERHEDNEEMFE